MENSTCDHDYQSQPDGYDCGLDDDGNFYEEFQTCWQCSKCGDFKIECDYKTYSSREQEIFDELEELGLL